MAIAETKTKVPGKSYKALLALRRAVDPNYEIADINPVERITMLGEVLIVDVEKVNSVCVNISVENRRAQKGERRFFGAVVEEIRLEGDRVIIEDSANHQRAEISKGGVVFGKI